MFNKIKEKIKFLRWAYEHRNCTSKDFVVPINMFTKEIIPRRYHAEKVVSEMNLRCPELMWRMRESVKKEICMGISEKIQLKQEKVYGDMYKISADIILGDENEFSK